MTNKEKLGYFTIGALLVVYGFIMLQVGKQRQIAQQHQTYNICIKAHFETSGASEQACGNAQDRTHTEFICNQDGTYCWLEVK
ncbi:MAG: hypothetical protein V4440_04470 [Pseudomonadota bacterium]